MRHTAMPPLVLDLIRLIQSGAEKVDCFSINTFYLLDSCTSVLVTMEYGVKLTMFGRRCRRRRVT